MKVFLAGRVAVELDTGSIDERRFPGRQGRLLFAYLVAERGRAVPRGELADALWGETPPATWEKALSVLVSKLRALLGTNGTEGAPALTSAFGCYRLELPEGTWVDVLAAATATTDAEAALAAGDLEQAKIAGGAGESLVREPFLPGDHGSWVEEKRREISDGRVRALAVLAEACLRSGEPSEAATWAAEIVALEPFRESGYRQLMEAHVAAGNRAEALRVYERCRRLLADELGTYPSPETEAVYRALLEQAPAEAPDILTLEDEQQGPRGTFMRRTRLWIVAGVAVVAAAAIVGGIFAARGSGRRAVPPNSVVSLDSSGSIAATVPVGARPVALATGAGSLWVGNFDGRSVTRVDVSSRRALQTIPLSRSPMELTATGPGVWVTDSAGGVSTIDTSYDEVTPRLRPSALGFGCCFYPATTPRPTLAAFGSVWVVDPDGRVTRLDPRTARQTGTVDVGNDPSAMTAGAGSLWVTNSSDGTLTRIDPATLRTTTISVGHDPSAVAVNDAGVWVTETSDDRVVRVDPDTDAVRSATHVGEAPTAILAASDALWVANSGDGTVVRLDPRSGAIRKRIHLGGTPDALAAAGGNVWVAVAPAPAPAPTAGGVAHVTSNRDLAPVDPALYIGPAISYATCANLLTYPDEPAPAGSHIVPEVAESVPTPTAGGTTYTFTIRPGFRFSPPSNQPVTAATFKSTIERVADPRLKSPFAGQLSAIAGYGAYVRGRAPGLRGVVARGRTLTIRLSRPDGSFLANIASGVACAVPTGTPAVSGGLDYVPSAGPYYVASYSPRQQLVLKRNPNYHGDRPRRFDQIVVTIGVSSGRAVSEIEAGTADYALDALPRNAGPRLTSSYGPGSPAAKDGHQQYFISPANGARYLHMNVSRPLFSKARIRRAVSYAIDRPALVAQGRRFAEANPFNAGEPTGDYMSPVMEGGQSLHVNPLDGPDLARAKRLAGHLHATAVMYTPDLPPWLQETQVIRRDLAPLGIRVKVKEFPIGDFYERIGRRGEPFDLAVSGWGFGGTDPAQVFMPFDGRTIGRTGNIDFSYFDDPGFNRKLDAAAKLSGVSRYRAYRNLEGELERDLVPAAPFASDASRDFFSARIGCQLYQPVMGIDLAALCLRN